jgi:S1-C subfamily serine protease
MKVKGRAIAVFIIAGLLSSAAPVDADIIYLKNGEKLEGTIKEERKNSVVIDLDFGTIAFTRSEIERIEKKPIRKKEKDPTKPVKKKTDLIEYKGRKYTKERFERLIKQKGLEQYEGKWVTEHEKLGLQLDKHPKATNTKKIVEYASPAVVSIKIDDNKMGSGVLINSNGLFITNYHVVKDAKKIRVKLFDNDAEYPARVVSYKEFRDLALVSIGGTDRPHLKLADPEEVGVGDSVIALGNPLGFTTTVTTGIISSIRRLKDFPGAEEADLSRWQEELRIIQTDAAINPGNSGGPLISKKGRIVGINTFGVSKNIAEGLNFAIHAKELKKAYSSYFE